MMNANTVVVHKVTWLIPNFDDRIVMLKTYDKKTKVVTLYLGIVRPDEDVNSTVISQKVLSPSEFGNFLDKESGAVGFGVYPRDETPDFGVQFYQSPDNRFYVGFHARSDYHSAVVTTGIEIYPDQLLKFANETDFDFVSDPANVNLDLSL